MQVPEIDVPAAGEFTPFEPGRPSWPASLRALFGITAGPRVIHTLFVQPTRRGLRVVLTDGRRLEVVEASPGHFKAWGDRRSTLPGAQIDAGDLDVSWTDGRADGDDTVLSYTLDGRPGELRCRGRHGFETPTGIGRTSRPPPWLEARETFTATHGWPDAPGGWALDGGPVDLADLDRGRLRIEALASPTPEDVAMQVLGFDADGVLQIHRRGEEPPAEDTADRANLLAFNEDHDEFSRGRPKVLRWRGEPGGFTLPDDLPPPYHATFRGDLAAVVAGPFKDRQAVIVSRTGGLLWREADAGWPRFVGPRELLWGAAERRLRGATVSRDGLGLETWQTTPVLPRFCTTAFHGDAAGRRRVSVGAGTLLVLEHPPGRDRPVLARLEDSRFNVTDDVAATADLRSLAWVAETDFGRFERLRLELPPVGELPLIGG